MDIVQRKAFIFGLATHNVIIQTTRESVALGVVPTEAYFFPTETPVLNDNTQAPIHHLNPTANLVCSNSETTAKKNTPSPGRAILAECGARAGFWGRLGHGGQDKLPWAEGRL